MKSFDPQVLFDHLPSFYQDQLAGFDREFLSKYWEGIVRVVDAEYVRLFQTADSPKIGESPVTSFYPWVRQEFDGWTSRDARHQHSVVRNPGDVNGVFYFGRYFVPESIKLWYDGHRKKLDLPSVASNDPDGFQVQHLINPLLSPTTPLGTRIELNEIVGGQVQKSTAFGDPAKQVVVEGREEFRSVVIMNGIADSLPVVWREEDDTTVAATINPDLAEVRAVGRLLNLTPGYSIDDATAENPTITLDSGFRKGQVIQVTRFNGHQQREVIDADGTTYQIKFPRSQSGAGNQNVVAVSFVFDVPIFPNPTTVEPLRVTFSRPLPVGVRVRVVDPGGTQSFETTKVQGSFTLEREVDPANTDVFVFNLNLSRVESTATEIDFARPPLTALLIDYRAPFTLGHDHARQTTVVLQASNTVSLPATRPLALQASLDESARFPVHVYVQGRLLEDTAYTFPSTTQVQLTAGSFAKGDRVDVVYADAEEAEDHVHFLLEDVVPDNQLRSAVEFPEDLEPDRYPVLVEQVDGPIIAGANHPTALDRFVQFRPEVAGPTTLFAEGVARGLNYRFRMPGRADEEEAYLGTLVSAESLQDGIDVPTTELSGKALKIVRDGDETVVETDEAIGTGWFKNASVDEHVVSNVLGVPIGFLDGGASSERYRDVVCALYAAYYRGSQVETLENFGCIVLGSAFARREGVNRGILFSDTGDGRSRRVEHDDGLVTDVELHRTIPDRPLGEAVPLFQAMSAHCVVRDRDLSGVPWLAFFAEAVAEEYRYAKRIDVRKPREHSGTVDAYNEEEEILTDNKSDFIDLEVWPNDLIRLTTTGEPLIGAGAVTVYRRVIEVIDEHNLRVSINLAEGGAGWGQPDGWGETTGWGGFIAADDLDNYTIWTRKTRRLDTFKFLDEMLNEAQAIAEGETVQRVNEILASVLNRFIFTVKVDWDANRDRKALDDLKFFLDSAKAADTGYFAYTEVNNDDGITDRLDAAIVDREPELEHVWRWSYVGMDYVGSSFIAPDLVSSGVGSATFDDNWWDPAL